MNDSSAVDPQSLGGRLIELGDERELRRGEVLFNQRDPASAVFWVRLGRLRLERHLEAGRVVTLSVATAPTVVAEAALFSDHYHCRAIAEAASRISIVPKTVVLDLLDGDASFAASFVRALATEVRTVRHLLELRNVRPASERGRADPAPADRRDRPTLWRAARRAPRRPPADHRPAQRPTDRELCPTPRLRLSRAVARGQSGRAAPAG